MLALIVLQAGTAGLLAFSPASDTAWHDPSPHRVLHVPVARSVSLEVLDWGGAGPPLVFLAGGGNTAHVYDGFAPRFSGCFHVLGITRRGVGASSHPSLGYDTTTLVRDIIAILDSLGVKTASFVAHSFGGSELNYLAAHYPKRVDRLVYLDSGMDSWAIFQSSEWRSGVLPAPQPPTPSYDDDVGTGWSWTLWADRLSGPGYPEAEVRATLKFDANDRFVGTTTVAGWLEKAVRGTQRVDLRLIRAPVLALYADPGSAEVMYPYWETLDPTSRARGQKAFEALARLHSRLRSDFIAKVEHGRVVIVPGARHYIFLTHPGEVTHAMLEFLLP
jgi:pimeloyl-ACP methyl ester carboxylesterase